MTEANVSCGIRVGRPGVARYPSRMMTPQNPLYVGYRYPAGVVDHASGSR